MLRRLRLVGTMAAIALLALFTLVPLAGAAPRAAETKTVSIKDFAFDPKTISVSVGDTITWTNDGPSPHTVSADDGSFESGNLDKGATFSQTFAKAGTFAYFCKYHGSKGGVSMAGSVAVGEPAAAAPATANGPSGTVDAADQAIANGGITVANVTAGQDGWIVAHLDEGGKPGKVIGNTAVKKGENKNVAIKLSEDVPAGGKLWPMLHIDAGTIGTYEFPGADAPVVVGGKVVMKQIAVTAAAAPAAATKDAVDADNQAIKNGSITVAEIYASQDGWIAVHLDEGGKPGKVLGQTAVKKGENKNVAVKLSEDVPAGGKLWPMLHIDAGVIGTYEFPGPDAPVIVGGNVIMKQISVTAAGAAAPAKLPTTGGEDAPVGLLLAALGLLLAGTLLTLRPRRA